MCAQSFVSSVSAFVSLSVLLLLPHSVARSAHGSVGSPPHDDDDDSLLKVKFSFILFLSFSLSLAFCLYMYCVGLVSSFNSFIYLCTHRGHNARYTTFSRAMLLKLKVKYLKVFITIRKIYVVSYVICIPAHYTLVYSQLLLTNIAQMALLLNLLIYYLIFLLFRHSLATLVK